MASLEHNAHEIAARFAARRSAKHVQLISRHWGWGVRR